MHYLQGVGEHEEVGEARPEDAVLDADGRDRGIQPAAVPGEGLVRVREALCPDRDGDESESDSRCRGALLAGAEGGQVAGPLGGAEGLDFARSGSPQKRGPAEALQHHQ